MFAEFGQDFNDLNCFSFRVGRQPGKCSPTYLPLPPKTKNKQPNQIALLRRRIEAAMFFYAALLVGAVHAAHFRSDGQAGENPIRKIVSLLQKMQKEVMDEQDKDTELNEKSGQYM